MATTTTTNIALVKPDYSEAADVQVLNGNADKIDAAFGVTYNAFGIVVNGNKAALGAATGQFVILKNSTISGRPDGLYTAAKAIPANTAIDSTYLTAVSGGGLNEVKSRITWGETSTPSDHPHYIDINRGSYSSIIACIKSNANYNICAYPYSGSAFRVIVRSSDGSLPSDPVAITYVLLK